MGFVARIVSAFLARDKSAHVGDASLYVRHFVTKRDPVSLLLDRTRLFYSAVHGRSHSARAMSRSWRGGGGGADCVLHESV